MAESRTPKGVVVDIKLHQIEHDEFIFSDYVDTAKYNSGSEVLEALKKCEQVHNRDRGNAELIIPYHSIDNYSYGVVPYDGQKPSDAFCK